jgi:hypothetical protein
MRNWQLGASEKSRHYLVEAGIEERPVVAARVGKLW